MKPQPPSTSFVAAAVLLVTGLAETILSMWQWAELFALRQGEKPACAVNETVNCETVWNSPLATWIHSVVRVPVAGLGIVWGLAAVAVAVMLLVAIRRARDTRPWIGAARVVAALGVVAVVVFAAESLRVKAVCVTCLTTYALTLVYAAAAWKLSPLPLATEVKGGATWAATLLLGGYIVALVVSFAVPTPVKSHQADLLANVNKTQVQTGPTDQNLTPDEQRLRSYIQGLPAPDRQMLSNALAFYKVSQPRMSSFPIHKRYGPDGAGLRMVEWTDILCGHCASLAETVSQLKKVVPPGSLSVEPRHYPLDKECNPNVSVVRDDAPGVRCLAAKAQICLEPQADYWEVRDRLFQAQRNLTSTEKVLEIASSGSLKRDELIACVLDPKTHARLQEDVRYASLFNPEGTPIVVLNGREGWPLGPFLYAMAITRGNADSPAFKGLPPPQFGDDGHGH